MSQPSHHHELAAAQKLIHQASLLNPGEQIIVAVSGGPDSMALLEALSARRTTDDLRLVVAHLVHGFRPADAQREAAFVRQQAELREAPCVVFEVDTPAYMAQRKLSPQAAARELRYQFLRDLQVQRGAQKIAVGHTADDQVETLLLNLLRGTGPRGLGGMRPATEWGLIRPFLTTWRPEIMAYLRARGTPFLDDPSNEKQTYLRNRIRHHLLPLLEEQFQPNIRAHLQELAHISQLDADYLDATAAEAAQHLVRPGGAEALDLSATELRELPPAIAARVIRWCVSRLSQGSTTCSATHVQAVLGLVDAHDHQASSQYDLADDICAWLAYGNLRLQRRRSLPSLDAALPLPVPGSLALPHGSLCAEVIELGNHLWPRFHPDEAWVDYARLRGSLKVRTRQPGDRLQPLGMGGTKSLKELFIDDKIPPYERDGIPLVVDEEAILWVVGWRLNHAYRLTAQTRQALVLRYSPRQAPSSP